MKAPINCPICGDPMLNSFPPAEELTTRFTKSCSLRLTHKLKLDIVGDNVEKITIDIGNGMEAHWTFSDSLWVLNNKKSGSLYVSSKDNRTTSLPWFEPNLRDYKKLVNKVKTYLVFS